VTDSFAFMLKPGSDKPRYFSSVVIAFLLAVLSISAVWAVEMSPLYRVLRSIAVAGDGGWDYLAVDTASRKLYVSHGDRVNVLDIDSEAVRGQIDGLSGVRGIAFAPKQHRAFITEGLADRVTMVNTDTLKKLGTVTVGMNPDAVIYDPATDHIFVNNNSGASTTVLDARTGAVLSTIALGGNTEYATADGTGHVFVNLEEENETLDLDSRTAIVVRRWRLGQCKAPTSMAMDRTYRRLFLGCRNHFMEVLNADNGQVVTALPIGDHVDTVIFDAERHLIFCSNGDGTLNIFAQNSPDQYKELQTLTTEKGARTIALDPVTHRIFLSRAQIDTSVTPQPGRKPPVLSGTFHLLVVGSR
jgi:DNA-binding beta-propeller fold protein YncE